MKSTTCKILILTNKHILQSVFGPEAPGLPSLETDAFDVFQGEGEG